MNFTFGIVTAGGNGAYIQQNVEQIRKQEIPAYEIIIVGETTVKGDDILHIPFDETQRPGWIGKKKNIIADVAKYENLVIMHDYYMLCDGWYKGFVEFREIFQVCATPVITLQGKRFRDYLFSHQYNNNNGLNKTFIPYTYTLSPHLSKLAYVNGAYYILKTELARRYRYDETLSQGEEDDIALFQLFALNDIRISINPNSKAQILKEKEDICSDVLTEDELRILESFTPEEVEDMLQRTIFLHKRWLRLTKTSSASAVSPPASHSPPSATADS